MFYGTCCSGRVYLTGLWPVHWYRRAGRSDGARLCPGVGGRAAARLALRLLRLPVRVHVWLMRGTPLLVQIVLSTALAAGGIFPL